MTSLAVALAVDQRGPAALYIITDSRFSWGPGAHWDAGQKTFASIRTPDIFGFCGDAFFPPAIIHQVIELINRGVLCADGMPADERHALALAILKHAVDRQQRAPISSFSIFHGSRDGELMKSKFRLWETRVVVDAN